MFADLQTLSGVSILSEQRKKETDAEIITTLAENLFLYPEGELQPHSCLQDRVKAFSPWYIATAINFLDKLKLTFILKRKITCCVKHLLILAFTKGNRIII